ncbi:MAG: ATP synthase F0 subunit C, partial [bacterium]
VLLFLVVTTVAHAQEGSTGLDPSVKRFIALASGFGIAIAACGGAIGQSRAITAGLEGIARNPGASGMITTPLIIGLALIESLVIYAFVIAFLLQLKL